jgi:hypothetical protein
MVRRHARCRCRSRGDRAHRGSTSRSRGCRTGGNEEQTTSQLMLKCHASSTPSSSYSPFCSGASRCPSNSRRTGWSTADTPYVSYHLPTAADRRSTPGRSSTALADHRRPVYCVLGASPLLRLPSVTSDSTVLQRRRRRHERWRRRLRSRRSRTCAGRVRETCWRGGRGWMSIVTGSVQCRQFSVGVKR